MKVLYDHQAFLIQSHGGVSKSFVELISHMPSGIKYEISINENENIHLKEKQFNCDLRSYDERLKDFAFSHSFKGKKKIFNCINLLTNQSIENESNLDFSIRRIKKGDFDIFHPTFFDDYFLDYIKKKPFILTIHDMIPELFRRYYKNEDFQTNMKKKLGPLATHIVAVSENTKNDIIRILGINEDKISVIYHGAPEIKNNIFSKSSPFSFPYILYVGERRDYKNFEFLIKEFSVIAKKEVDIQLICTSMPFNVKEFELINKFNLYNRVINKFVSQNELLNLYKHALMFIYPSEYEGFGMPILEAFSCGCPVLLNNASCFPEIGGDAVNYFNIIGKDTDFIDMFYKTIAERENLIKRGYERVCNFSWTKSANKLSDIYKNNL